ncbi:MAG: hypothetical protein R2710_17455 [Acidimicrobiales bacterium]
MAGSTPSSPLCSLFAIAGLGPKWSIDEALGLTDDVNGLVGAAIALVVGVAAGIGQIAAFYRPPAEADAAISHGSVVVVLVDVVVVVSNRTRWVK